MKNLTSKDYINKYTQVFQKALPLCMQYRKEEQWEKIIQLIKDPIFQFEKLPESIQQKIDPFVKGSLFFFLAEAQYHLKQQLNAEGLLALDTKDEKINQIKAKTYYMLYKQTNKIEHIEYALQLATEFFGSDHKITKFYKTEFEEKQRKIKFQQLSTIPDFEAFKQGLEFSYFTNYNKKQLNQSKGKTIHLSEIEKLTTEASTFEPSKRIKYRGNESLLRISDQKINIFVPLQNKIDNVNTKSLIQFRQNTTTSELRGSINIDSVQENQQAYLHDLLLSRPQTAKFKHPKRIIKTQASPQKNHQQKESIVSVRGTNLKKSQIKLHPQIMKTSSKQKIDIKEQLVTNKIMDTKSIQCEISEQVSQEIEQRGQGEQFNFVFSPRVGQSYYSLNTSKERTRHQLDFEYLNDRIEQLYHFQQEKALRMIIKNFRSFVQKQRQLKLQNLDMKKSVTKQHFSNLVVELGAAKNLQIDEKIQRIKSILHICQVIDQGSFKQWMIFSPIRQIRAVQWRIKNISWIIFKRLKSKKSQMHPDIVKLYKEYPKYPQIIEIWSNSIDGTNAIFVLSLQVETKGKQYDIRLHLKNVQHIAKEYENIFSSTDLITNLINLYFATHGIQYDSKIRQTTQYILTKQTLLRQDMVKKGCQSISNHINQLFISNFLHLRTENGQKFRRVTFSEEILENQVNLFNQIDERRKIYKKIFQPLQIGSNYFELKNQKNQKLIKSVSIALENYSPAILTRSQSPKNYWSGLRSQSFRVGFRDEIVEEVSFTPGSGKSSPRSPIRQKNNTFSSSVAASTSTIPNRQKTRKILYEDYFKSYPKQRNVLEKPEIPFNPYQSEQILLVFLTKSDEGWCINHLTFTFNFECPTKFGHFLITTTSFSDRESDQLCLSLKEFSCRVDLHQEVLKRYLGFYRNLPFIAGIRFLNSQCLGYSRRQRFLIDKYAFPQYRNKFKLQRRSVVGEQINKDHYFIFFYRPSQQQRTLFKIKSYNFKGREINELLVYKIGKPVFIKIISKQHLQKLQDLFSKIIHQNSQPQIGEFQQFQKVLNYYIQKEYKAIGCCLQIGFQTQTEQIFNYELKSLNSSEIYSTLLQHLIANESNIIRNLLRTYCRIQKYQVVSKVNNFKGTNLIQFTQYTMSQDIEIIEIQIFPFDKRLGSHKTYLNHNDLKNFNIQGKEIVEIALFLKNKLSLAYNGNLQQVNLTINSDYSYVNQLNENIGGTTEQHLFVKQKTAITLIFQTVKKLDCYFIIISLFQNTLNEEITFQLYIPHLCKQFRCVMSAYDFSQLRSSKLDSIVPGNFLENYEEYSKQIPNRYNSFFQYISQFKQNNIDDQFSNKSRVSEQSAFSSISIQKYKDYYDKLQQQKNDNWDSFQLRSSQTQHQHQEQIQTSTQKQAFQQIHRSETKKSNSKTYFGRMQYPQRVGKDCLTFKERVSVKPSISKFDTFYDSLKLQKLLKNAATSKSLVQKFLRCYFWQGMIESCNVIMTNYNKYILQMDTYRGILRQLGVKRRVFIDDDYLAEIFFEQDQVEYGSMFEKYSFISLKESQNTNIYFSYKRLNGGVQKTINLKCQFRQCQFNYSQFNQVSYNTALRILKQSSDFITEQIKINKQVIEFPKVDKKSIISLRTNKKTIQLDTYVNNHSKYKFIYQSRLMVHVILTLLYKKDKFYFYLEDCKKQVSFQLKKTVKSVQENIPHIHMLLKCEKDFTLGQRLLQTYKNQLIIKVYENLYKTVNN